MTELRNMTVVDVLASALGVQAPSHITTKEEFIEWYKTIEDTKKVVEIPKEDTVDFVSVANSSRIAEMRSKKNSYLESAEQYMVDSHKQLLRAHDVELEILAALGLGKKDVGEELNRVLEDGFYTYKGRSSEYLAFVTEPVSIFIEEKTEVKLGRFEVHLYPYKIKVLAYEDNTDVSGYVHPHVSSRGDVCWGTAAQIYTDGMKEFQFSKVMAALRAILTQYNADSPYIEAYRFLLKRGEIDLSEYSYTYVEADDEERLEEDLLPSDISGNTYILEDDEDGSSAMVTVYERYYQDLDYVHYDVKYYKTKTGEYKEWEF